MDAQEEVWVHVFGISDETSLEGLRKDGKACLYSLERYIAPSSPDRHTSRGVSLNVLLIGFTPQGGQVPYARGRDHLAQH